jgi:LEA14-like dessication related protein
MKSKLFGLCLSIVLMFAGCGTIGDSLLGAYNVTRCDYSYKSISNLMLSGMNLSSGLSATNITKIVSLLSGTATSIPLNFTLNLDVKNPNSTAAALSGLQYIINIDDMQFTTGQVNQALNIASGATQTLPLNIGVDLASLMQGNSKTAVANIAKNFLGIGSDKSNVTVQLKPTFMVGNTPITSPSYIPVSFSFGGK